MKTTPWFLLLASLCLGQLHANPVISEFMASNLEALEDEDEAPSDWIEFYNPTDSSINLNGHFLTDDRRNLRKWKVPGALNLSPGGYGLVFASRKDRGGLFASTFHTNFELATGGEYLALVAPDGETILSEFADAYPKQRTGLSFGLGNNEAGGTEWRYFETPTPEAANGEGRVDLPPVVADTKFSHTRGFYDAPITVEITTATEGATIYYSTDGSDPGPGSVFVPGKRYTEPLTVSETTLLRARAFKDGLEPTNIDTHTYLFIDSVLQQSDEQPGLPDRWNGQPSNYGISQDIVEDPKYRDLMHDAFRAIPTLSIVTEEDNLWASDGLYLNTTQSAPDGSGADFRYEFQVSAELLRPDGEDGFHIQAGLRAQGGASRNADRSPKHALSLRFRRVYGAGRLEYPILQDSPQQSFDAIHLRARYNNSWIHSNAQQRQRAQYIRDQWARDSMLEMGTPSGGHGDYHHIYLNGLYWGIYVVQERMDSAHYADYYGGLSDEIDSVNGGRATNGSLTSFNAMKSAARSGNWEEIQRRLDVDNYIDWHIIQRFGSNRDWKNDGNWKAAGGGEDNLPWRFYAWDTERILEGVTEGTPTPSADPSGILNDLRDVPEFEDRFADRLHKHLFNGGALTSERNIARYERRAQQLELAVIAESARWGDHRRASSYERDEEWQTERERVIEDYFPRRTKEVIEQYQDLGLYPRTEGVELNQFGGRVPSGFSLRLSSKGASIFNPADIYFTTDGTDPRDANGEVSASAAEYSSPFELTESLPLKARVLSAQNGWSALTETYFAVGTEPASAESVVISELMYHPGPPTAEESEADHVSSDDFEFIEVQNVSDAPVDLAGSRFDNGIRFTFAAGPLSVLAPGESAFLVRDLEAYHFRYGNEAPTPAGVFADSFANGGERVRFLAEDGSVIANFAYSDSGSWPETADGSGFSLVLKEGLSAADADRGDSWQASAEAGGSPGAANSAAAFEVVINEILTNSAAPDVDAIELYNAGDAEVDVSGWWLTDEANTPGKFALPAGSVLPPKGYLVVLEDDDADPSNNDSLPPQFFGKAFGLSSRGDAVHLFSTDGEGNLTGYNDGFSFGAAEEGVTFGRHVDSQGRVEYPPQSSPSLGQPNAAPAVGDVVIAEIMYHSDRDTEADADVGEFLELVNRSEQSLSLEGWGVEGIRYQFPTDARLEPGGVLVLARVDAATFAEWYELPAGVSFYGPYEGRLNNDGERLTLYRPGETYEDGEEQETTRIIVDSVRYNDAAPWPIEADGQGHSLERSDLNAYADEVTHWRVSAAAQGSPGVVEGNTPPDPGTLTYSAWQKEAFTADQLAEEAIVGPSADPDEDLLPNRVEWVMGTSPLEANAAPLSVSRSTEALTLTYQRRRSLAEVTVRAQLSTNLTEWTEAGNQALDTVANPIDDRLERVTLSIRGDEASTYLRLAID